jgi:hypothetical protein
MGRIWCCKEFEAHAVERDKGGFRIILAWKGRRGFLSLLHYEGGLVGINFCPWCGRNLEEYYTSPESMTGDEEQE